MTNFGAVTGNMTMNTYTGLNLAQAITPIIGLVVVAIFFVVLAVMPRLIRRLIVGYITLVLAGFALLILYVLALSVEPISNWLWFDVFNFIGELILNYGLYILVSLPIAYAAGGYLDKKLFVETAIVEDKNA